jgi:lipopolysaccharide export system protein LptA
MARTFPRLLRPAALVLGLFLGLGCAAPQGAAAAPAGESLLPGSSSREPINIAADKLDYFDKDRKLVYSGDVVAVQGDSRLNASVLTIYLDKKTGGGRGVPSGARVRRMVGRGPIAITNKDQVGTGDKLIYDKRENKVYLIGHVALAQGQNVTRGDRLVYDLNTGQAVVSSTGRVRSLLVPNEKSGKPTSPEAARSKEKGH